jgi:NAD(P)H-hydrate repair Nnr-like enzyme with NAD(P)H-hydrate dehydratase domain
MNEQDIKYQTKSNPLFEDLLWSRPENRQHAGKLLIIGGNKFSFNSPAEAYSEAERAGAGTIRVILPDSLKSTISKIFPAADFAQSNPSGGLSNAALAEITEQMEWASCTLLSGDLGHNSETAVLIEKIVSTKSMLVLAGDSLDSFLLNPRSIISRENILLILNFQKLQKISTHLKIERPLTSMMPTQLLIEAMREISSKFPAIIELVHENRIYIGCKGRVSVTAITKDANLENKVAAHSSVWWMQNPSKPFEAITSSLVDFAI